MERKIDFDIAKGLGAYLVVLGHVQQAVAGQCSTLITLCHMPLFFWISGYFMRRCTSWREWWNQAVRKTRRLLLPYFIWSAAALALNILPLLPKGSFSLDAAAREFTDIFLYARSTWFLAALWIVELMGSLACVLSRKLRLNKYILLTAFWIGSVALPLDGIFQFYKVKWLMPFFIFGAASNEFALYERANKRAVLCAGCLFPILGWTLAGGASFDQYITCAYTGAGSVLAGAGYYVVSGLSVCLVMGLSGTLGEKVIRWAAPVGQISLEIYVLHMFFVKLLSLLPAVDGVAGQVLQILYAAVIVAVIWVLVTYILNRIPLFRLCVGREWRDVKKKLKA